MTALTLAEYLVLAILDEQPAHGFAVAQQTAHGAELGQIWHVPKAVVYRAIGRLLDVGMIKPESVEPGQGPQRTVYAVTPEGSAAAREWLRTPVEHARDIRSELLPKLALLHRAGAPFDDLLRRQREVLEPIVGAIEARQGESSGFDRVLLSWRRTTLDAALNFVDEVREL